MESNIEKLNKTTYKFTNLPMLIIVGVFVLIIYFIPFILLGENSNVRIHDNLDSEIPWRALLAKDGYMFASHTDVREIMNGLPRFCLPSSLNVNTLFYLFFPPFYAYLLNDFIIRLIAFLGMIFLLKKHFSNSRENICIFFGVSICFSFLPFYSVYGLSVAGQPLLLYAFLNLIKKNNSIFNFLIILVFPFYSSFVLSGIFIICALFVLLLFDMISKKKLNMVFLFGFILLIFSFLISEYQLVTSVFFNTQFVSHRIEWKADMDSLAGLKFFIDLISRFIASRYHAASINLIIIFIGIAAFIFFLIKKDKNSESYINVKQLLILFISAILLSFLSVFYRAEILTPLKEQIVLFKIINFDRFYFLLPIVWYLAFAVALLILIRFKKGNIIVIGLICIQLLYILYKDDELKGTLANGIEFMTNKKYEINPQADSLTGNINFKSYKAWASTSVYRDIDRFIGKPKKDYRVISIGIDPMISIYNGFYALDSYQNLYSLQYKHKFRKIIEKELDKNVEIKNYFDYWGNRCYTFCAETGNKLFHLELNIDAFKELGGKYIISNREIINFKENDLTFLSSFVHNDANTIIYLYCAN
jgi:hypothetical protein